MTSVSPEFQSVDVQYHYHKSIILACRYSLWRASMCSVALHYTLLPPLFLVLLCFPHFPPGWVLPLYFSLFIALMYSTVCFIILMSPSSLSILILPMPTLFLNAIRCSLYSQHSSTKCATVSFPYPHSQYGLFLFSNRYRLLFNPQCPVRSCASFAHAPLFAVLL